MNPLLLEKLLFYYLELEFHLTIIYIVSIFLIYNYSVPKHPFWKYILNVEGGT